MKYKQLALATGILPSLMTVPGLLPCSAGEDNKKLPNIILFLADDLGWTDTQVYGSDFYETPAVNRLASEGIVFTQAYAQPLCSPTRAAILTGKYPGARLRLHQAITGESKPEPKVPEKARPNQKMCYPESRDRLPLDEYTIAQALKQAGYQTWHFGKWHLKPWPSSEKNEAYHPVNRGFDFQVGVGDAGPGRNYFAPYMVPEFPEGPEGEYIAERMATEACNMMEQKYKEGPFFMYYAEFNVHAPFAAKKEAIDYYARKAEKMGPGKQRNPIYAAMVQGMDQALGRILDKLDQLGIAENTLLIFVSDNGAVSWVNMKKNNTLPFEGYEKWLDTAPTSSEPLKGHKHTYYEGGVRVPMVMRWPGKIKPGSKSTELVHVIDFYPTLLEVAGIKARPGQVLDGVSLIKVLQGGKAPDRPLFMHFPRAGFGMEGGSFVRKGDYKLIRIYGDGPDRSDRFELYNIANDLSESNNLSGIMPGKVKKMANVLDHWLKETGALIPVKNPAYNPGR